MIITNPIIRLCYGTLLDAPSASHHLIKNNNVVSHILPFLPFSRIRLSWVLFTTYHGATHYSLASHRMINNGNTCRSTMMMNGIHFPGSFCHFSSDFNRNFMQSPLPLSMGKIINSIAFRGKTDLLELTQSRSYAQSTATIIKTLTNIRC